MECDLEASRSHSPRPAERGVLLCPSRALVAACVPEAPPATRRASPSRSGWSYSRLPEPDLDRGCERCCDYVECERLNSSFAGRLVDPRVCEFTT